MSCKGVEANGSVWVGSTPRYVKTQEAKWGAARPFTPLHQYARHVQTFPGDARLGPKVTVTVAPRGSSAHSKPVADLGCLA